MLHPVRASSAPPLSGPIAAQAAIQPPVVVPGEPPTADRPFVFENLPSELLREVGGYVFRAAVRRPDQSVDVLAGNTRLRNALSAELHAGRVLRDIHASRDLAGLLASMDAIHQVLPNYRQGCLSAVLHLLPRMGVMGAMPPAFRDRFEALLPTLRPASESDPEGIDPAAQLLLELTRMLHRHTPRSTSHLEHALALAGRQAPVPPALAQALLGWSAEILGRPGPSGTGPDELRERLLAAAPRELHRQMGSLCRFASLLATNSSEERMAQALAGVPVADLPDHLRAGTENWGLHALLRTRTQALYESMFRRLDTPQQIALLQDGTARFSPKDVVKFLRTKVGRVPATTIARIFQARCAALPTPGKSRLIRELVQAAAGTPALAEVLHRVIDRHTAADPALHALITEHAARTGEAERQAIALRLDLESVGCGESPASPHGEVQAMSRRVDDLLAGAEPVSQAAVETLVNLNVGWLDLRQRSRLLRLIQALPPGASARALSQLIDDIPSLHELPSFQRTGAPALTREAIAACAGLPPDHQAGPLSHLLRLLRLVEPDRGELSSAVSRLYDALPVRLRPAISAYQQAALQPQEA